MKLFDKYLLACTNQRIPMPSEWQKSLGLDLTDTTQVTTDSKVELGGYRFQQDDTLERGYISREIKSYAFDDTSRYLLQMYLTAIKDHRGTDFTPYFSLGTSTYLFPYYTTTTNIILGRPYTIFGGTARPVTIRIYSEASGTELYSEECGSLNTLEPKVINTSKILNDFISQKEVPGLTLRGNLRGYVSGEEIHGDGLAISSKGFMYAAGDTSSGLLLSVPVDTLVTITGTADAYKLHYSDDTQTKTLQNDVPTILEAGAYYIYPGELVESGTCLLKTIRAQAIAIDMANTIPYIFNCAPASSVSIVADDDTPLLAEDILSELEQYDSKTKAILASHEETTTSVAITYSVVTLESGEEGLVAERDVTTSTETKYYAFYDPATALAAEHEYIILEVVAYNKVTILQGSYMHFPMKRTLYEHVVDSTSIPSTIVLKKNHIAISGKGFSESIEFTVYNQFGRTITPTLGDDGSYYCAGKLLSYSIINGANAVSVSESGLVTALVDAPSSSETPYYTAEIAVSCGDVTVYVLVTVGEEPKNVVAGITTGYLSVSPSNVVLVNYADSSEDQDQIFTSTFLSVTGEALSMSGIVTVSFTSSSVVMAKTLQGYGLASSAILSGGAYAWTRVTPSTNAKGGISTQVVIAYTHEATGATYYGSATVSVVHINEATQIEVTSLPKSVYLVGEEFDSTDIVITASFTNGMSADLLHSTLSFSDVDTSSKGEQEVTVSCICSTSHSDLTTSFSIIVLDPKDAQELIITSLPSTLIYVTGSTLDLTDLSVALQFEDGTLYELSSESYSVEAIELTEVGTKEVTVTYKYGSGKSAITLTATFEVTVMSAVDFAELTEEASTSDICFTARIAITSSTYTDYYPVLLPEAGYRRLNYSDKLVPSLLDATVTENSTIDLQDLVTEGLIGGSLTERIAINTDAIYDVDGFIGNKLIW